ncbi:MAG: protein kinase domain-containing protein [Sarcina sp.]
MSKRIFFFYTEHYKHISTNFRICKNRAQVIEYFLVDENLIVIEELVNGRTIENILQIEDLDKDEIVRIIIGICNGLSDIHNMKEPIIRRDIKLSNIMINVDKVMKKDKLKKGDEEENIFMSFDSMNEIESNILGNKVATIGKKKLVNAKDISLGTYKNIKSKRDEKKKIKEQKYREKEKNIWE